MLKVRYSDLDFLFWVLCLRSFVMCFGVCRLHEEFESLWDWQPWPDHGVAVCEGLSGIALFSACSLGSEPSFCFRLC